MAIRNNDCVAKKVLATELNRLKQEPVEGFNVDLVDDSDFFKWKVGIFGPPETLYSGGYFKAIIEFPIDYPYSPPSFKFTRTLFHPNIYKNGIVCISILHQPGNDPQSGELASERWTPSQSVRTILLSVISLLNEPNISSPANVDASLSYRNWRDSKGSVSDYEQIVKKQVEDSKKDAEADGVKIPTTVDEYCNTKQNSSLPANECSFDEEDFYDDYNSDDSEDEVNDDDVC